MDYVEKAGTLYYLTALIIVQLNIKFQCLMQAKQKQKKKRKKKEKKKANK